jgi:RimJ/RimL family protein N-acetyltransferase
MATVKLFLSAVSAEFADYRDALRHDLTRRDLFLEDRDMICLIAARDAIDGGFMLLSGISDRHNGVCMKRIVVANPDGGFGTKMVRAGLDWIFQNTAAARVWLDTLRHNARAAHVYRKVGFVQEGVFREAYDMPQGDRVDRIVMSVLRREWAGAG